MYKLSALILLAISMSNPVLADDIWPEEVFPEGQTRSLNKGEYWTINCMDFTLKTKELKAHGQVYQRNTTITCLSDHDRKAYFICRADSIPTEMFLAVMCDRREET